MKKSAGVIFLIFLVLLPQITMAASFNGIDGEENLFEENLPQYLLKEKKHHRNYYKTWTVVDVTADKIILERNKNNDEVDIVSIARERRSNLEVGDKVRYDKIRNRLGNTVNK